MDLLRYLPLLLSLLLLGCKTPPRAAGDHARKLDAVIVPGCPTDLDGTPSACQWERAIWAAMLWEDGVTEHFITSGSSVYNRYIEAVTLKEALVALGVPDDRIYTETQALHSDENLGYSFAIAEDLGFERVGYASHDAHVSVLKRMLRGWGRRHVPRFRMDVTRVRARMEQGLPLVHVSPVPRTEWMPLDEREAVLAERTGEKRLPSWFLYTVGFVLGGLTGDEPVPPVPEPTLRGLRHRVDTRAWSADSVSVVGE